MFHHCRMHFSKVFLAQCFPPPHNVIHVVYLMDFIKSRKPCIYFVRQGMVAKCHSNANRCLPGDSKIALPRTGMAIMGTRGHCLSCFLGLISVKLLLS